MEQFRAALEAEDGDTASGQIATFVTAKGVGGGDNIDYEDDFADVVGFDESVQVTCC